MGRGSRRRTAAPGVRSDSMNQGIVRLTQPGAPERYRVNSAYTPRRLREHSFSAPPGLARLLRHKRECETRFRLSSPKCASPRGAPSRRRRELLSLFRSAQAGKLLPSRSLLPPVNATLGLVILSPVISGQQLKSRLAAVLSLPIFAAMRERSLVRQHLAEIAVFDPRAA